MTRPLLFALTLIVASPLAARAADPPVLEAGLAAEARKILDALRADDVKTVGVLKFLLAREGDKAFGDRLGTLNALLARRLEVALVVKNSVTKTVGVIEDASAVAARTPGASHLSRDGLDKLFAADYTPSWGRGAVKADAFLVGNGMVSADLRTLTLTVAAIDAKTRKPKVLVDKLVLKLRPEHLAETGESFTRGAFGDEPAAPEAPQADAVIAAAAKVRRQEGTHPLADAAAPFTLELVYDGKPQRPELRGGQAWVPEPTEGQKVEVRFARRDKSGRTLLAVVKVNGENTLGREKLPDDQARAWVLAPQDGNGPWSLAGFQVTNEEMQRFRVASRAESKAREVDYGTDVGTVSLVAFAERKGPASRAKDYEQKDELLIRRADLSGAGAKGGTFAAMQQDLYAGLDRGLILDGERVNSKVKVVQAERDPTPVMAATLFYYRK